MSTAILVVLSICIGAYASHFLLSERMQVMQQRIDLGNNNSSATGDIEPIRPREPLPRYSLGGSSSSYMGSSEVRDWHPAAEYRDVPLDWSELGGIIVTAELLVWHPQRKNDDDSYWVQARVRNITDDEVVAQGSRTYSTEGKLQRLSIPRSIGQKTYRVEVLGEHSSSLVGTKGERSSPNFPVKSPYGSPGSVKLLVPPTCFWGGTRFEVPRFS